MDNVKWFVKEMPQLFALDFHMSRGWGNGYVAIPKGHPWYGVSYWDLFQDIDIHGGLTFSQTAPNWAEEHGFDPEDWVIGFDTAHFGDTIQKWDEQSVTEETKRLYDMVISVNIER